MVSSFSNNNFARFHKETLVVWPNLGKPEIITTTKAKLQKLENISVEILVLTYPEKEISHIREDLTGKLMIIPILGLDPKTKQGIRIKKYPALIGEIIEYPPCLKSDPKKFEPQSKTNENYQLHSIEPLDSDLITRDFFLGRTKCYKITITFPITKEIHTYLDQQLHLLFDLEEKFNTMDETRILYHSICLSTRESWTDFNFIHITDLHIAKRNDEMLGVIKTKLPASFITKVGNLYDLSFKRIGAKLRTYFGKEKEQIEDKEIEVDVEEDFSQPIELRFRNPNNMLRRFNRFANLLADSNKLDFVVMTGDILDFCIRSDSPLGIFDFDYENTNWVRFIDLIINRELDPRKEFPLIGIEPNEELLVPIFTVVGNHDYRANHYAITSLGVNRHLGLTNTEAFAYSDGNYPTNPLYAPLNSMMAYNQYINPYQDFYLKIGDFTFIYLDSGWDSILEIKYLLMTDPSLIGFSDNQMTYLENLGKKYLDPQKKGKVFLFSHAPIINPTIKKNSTIWFLQKLHALPQFDFEDYKESRLRALGEKDPRSDIDLEYHSGGIADNWTKVMEFIEQYRGLALNGHTHKWLEFRTQRSEQPSLSHTGYGKRIQNPYAIYWDDYVKINANTPEKFDELLPLHLQTPAMGIQNRQWKLPPGGYRIVELQQNKIFRIAVNFTGTEQFMQKWHLT